MSSCIVRPESPRSVTIVVTGVCASGKSELVRRLRERGLAARSVAQEHSHVPALWKHEGEPDVLVYLQASARAVRRRGRITVSPAILAEQRARLRDAKRHAHVRIQTDHLTPDDVERIVLARLAGLGMLPATSRADETTGEQAARASA
jgi:nicotinamide riboside kinase